MVFNTSGSRNPAPKTTILKDKGLARSRPITNLLSPPTTEILSTIKLDQVGFPGSTHSPPRSCLTSSTPYLQLNPYNLLIPSHILQSLPADYQTTTHHPPSPSCSPNLHPSGSSHALPSFLSVFIPDPTDNLGSESSQCSFIPLLHLVNIF